MENTSSDALSAIICTLQYLNEPWGIKDLNSRHLYMNSAARAYTSTPPGFCLEGKYDYEFPAPWSEQSDGFIAHDKLAESAAETVSVIETDYWYNQRHLEPYLSEKIPLRDSGGMCIGTLWNAKRIKVISPLVCVGKKAPSIIQTSLPSSVFTTSEMNVVYLLLNRLSRKEIAAILGLSLKTINTNIERIYLKSGVHSLIQFEEYCENVGLKNYLPAHFLNKGIVFI